MNSNENNATNTSLYKMIEKELDSTVDIFLWMKQNFDGKPFCKKHIQEIEEKIKKLDQLKQDCLNNKMNTLELYKIFYGIKY